MRLAILALSLGASLLVTGCRRQPSVNDSPTATGPTTAVKIATPSRSPDGSPSQPPPATDHAGWGSWVTSDAPTSVSLKWTEDHHTTKFTFRADP